MPTLLHVLQHSLGRDEFGRPKSVDGSDYRNHYCIGPGGDGYEICRNAVDAGLMKEHKPREISGDDHIFTVTDAGKAYIEEYSPKPPKVSRSKARYERWLRLDGEMPFGEWLKGGSHG